MITLLNLNKKKIVATVRQALKIVEDIPSVLEYCETRMNQLLVDVTSMVGGGGEESNKHQVLYFLILVFVKSTINVRAIVFHKIIINVYYYIRNYICYNMAL